MSLRNPSSWEDKTYPPSFSSWAKKFIEPGVKFVDICEDCRWKDQADIDKFGECQGCTLTNNPGVVMPVKDLSKVYNSCNSVEVDCIDSETVKVHDKLWSTKYGEGKVKSMAPEYYERRYMKVDFNVSSKPIVMDVQYDLLGYEAIPEKGYESEMTLFYSPPLFRKSRVKVKGRMLRFEGRR